MKLTNLIGRGAQADVYEYEGQAVKLFHTNYNKAHVFFEGAVTSIIEQVGLPVAKIHDIVKIDGCWAIVMDLIRGLPIGRGLQNEMDDFVNMQVRIHNVANPLPMNNHHIYMNEIKAHPMLDKADKDRLLYLLDSLPDGNMLCHNDYHGLNVIKNDKEIHVIDWVNAKGGNPESDCCRTYMIISLYNRDLAEVYLEAYSSKAGFGREEILRWLPIVSAERLYEKKAAEIPQLMNWIKVEQ